MELMMTVGLDFELPFRSYAQACAFHVHPCGRLEACEMASEMTVILFFHGSSPIHSTSLLRFLGAGWIHAFSLFFIGVFKAHEQSMDSHL
jgi:hypothetical protein